MAAITYIKLTYQVQSIQTCHRAYLLKMFLRASKGARMLNYLPHARFVILSSIDFCDPLSMFYSLYAFSFRILDTSS